MAADTVTGVTKTAMCESCGDVKRLSQLSTIDGERTCLHCYRNQRYEEHAEP